MTWGYEDLRSPEVKAQQEAESAKRERKRKRLAAKMKATNYLFAGKWHLIETMPFEAYAESYGDGSTVLVSDGESVCVASVGKRIGRPVKMVKQPVHTMTDEGFMMVGGEFEEYDAPAWWFKWEFTDELSRNHDLYGKSEVGFIATHWQPFPAPPLASQNEAA